MSLAGRPCEAVTGRVFDHNGVEGSVRAVVHPRALATPSSSSGGVSGSVERARVHLRLAPISCMHRFAAAEFDGSVCWLGRPRFGNSPSARTETKTMNP